jgi:UDP-glucose 4-epimerase
VTRVTPLQDLAGECVLVTGGSGFLGSRLCSQLLESGAEVHGTSRSLPQRNADVRWSVTDVSDVEAIGALFRKVQPDLVFHLASHVTGSRELDAVLPTLNANLVSTIGILLAAATSDVKRVVLAGSLEEPDCSSGEPLPVSPYAAAKFAATAYGRMFHALHGVPVSTVRIFMVYGPGQRDETKLVPYVINSFLRGEAPGLSSGERPVDWVYVDDVVEALVLAATRGNPIDETIDLGSGVLTPIRGVVERIAQVMRPPVGPRFGVLPDRPNERVRRANVRRTRQLLGWTARTSLEEGLGATIAWYSKARDSAVF